MRTRVSDLAQPATGWLVVRCLRRVVAISGRERAFVLAGQAFTTVIPLLIIVSAATRQNGSDFIAERFNSRFRLTGAPAQALRTLFERPPGATGAITVVGLALLLFSLISLTRSLQRTFEAAWGLPPAGMRGTLHGLTGMGLLLASVLMLSVLVALIRPLPAGVMVAPALRTLAAAATWLLLQDLLLSRRVTWRRLVPGALVAGVGQTLVSMYSSAWMPRLIAHNADRYGVIGVTFAMLSWLIVIGFALVLFAAVAAELGHADSLDGPGSLPTDDAQPPAAPPNVGDAGNRLPTARQQ
jgi:membrane protein